MLAAVAADEKARIVTDLELKLCWSNAAVDGFLALDPALKIIDGVLSSEDLRTQRALTDLVARSASGTAQAIVRFAQHRGCYLLRVRRIGIPATWLNIDLAVDHSSIAVGYFDFGVVFGLTATEKKTALLMVEGLSAADIAQRSGVAVDTVRSHIRAIYSKLNVTTREQFFARTRAMRLP